MKPRSWFTSVTLPILSIKPDLPLDPVIVEILRHVAAQAAKSGIPCFVVGALARDILFHHIYGIHIARPTRDIDFGIAMKDWDQFATFKKALCDTSMFSPVNDMAQRLSYHSTKDTRGIPVDLVAFGAVESPIGTIAWPPDNTEIMTVTGFDEANANALTVQLPADGLTIRVTSIPGLALLKLVAWFERGHANPKDAHDLILLMRNYADAGNADRLYGEKLPLLESVNFELERAGAILLGNDVAAIARPETVKNLKTKLANPHERNRLLTQLAVGVTWTDHDDRLNSAESLLGALSFGLGI